MLSQPAFFESKDKVPAEKVSKFIRMVLKTTGIKEKELAQGTAISEAQLNRIAAGSVGHKVRIQTIEPLKRVFTLLETAQKVLSNEGVKDWISKPNPYLNDVPPILCLRSDKELEKVLSLLKSIDYGFPA